MAIVLGVATKFTIVVALVIFLFGPDIELLLSQEFAGRTRPDTFAGLNRVLPVFSGLLSISLAMSLWLVIRRRYSLLVALVAGPAMCVLGWSMTENFDDPHWFQLLAVASVGMLVSCGVTVMLSMVVRGEK